MPALSHATLTECLTMSDVITESLIAELRAKGRTATADLLIAHAAYCNSLVRYREAMRKRDAAGATLSSAAAMDDLVACALAFNAAADRALARRSSEVES